MLKKVNKGFRKLKLKKCSTTISESFAVNDKPIKSSSRCGRGSAEHVKSY